MDLSNRALGLLLIAAIVVSIGGTFISLNKLDAVSTTGFATNNVTGTVGVTVNTSLSIAMTDSTMSFGTCEVTPGAVVTINSENTGANQSECTISASDPLRVENDGNVNANVTISTDTTSSNAFSSTSSTFHYKTVNGSTNPGCTSGLIGSYTEMTSTVTEYGGCDVLKFGAGNEFDFHAQIALDETAVSDSITIEFEAHLTS
jgi:hypothetical protein